jgi:hypothetical protein
MQTYIWRMKIWTLHIHTHKYLCMYTSIYVCMYMPYNIYGCHAHTHINTYIHAREHACNLHIVHSPQPIIHIIYIHTYRLILHEYKHTYRYGFYVEARVSHAKPGMYTYRLEIIPPSVGPGKTLASVKPGMYVVHMHVYICVCVCVRVRVRVCVCV